jgi:hypothetical protein
LSIKKILYLIVLSILCTPLYAQKPPAKYGDIPLEDLKMTSYDKDPSASAVILFDYCEAYISVNAVTVQLLVERHVRIKILNANGLDYANIEVPLYQENSNEEKLTKLKATTYNLENGRVVTSDIDKNGIIKEKYSRNINLRKFTLPNVKEGSIIEYSYTINSDYWTQFPDWQFQYDIPVRHSEYWALFPDFFIFQKYMQGYLTPTVYETKHKNGPDFQIEAHHWVMKDVPAFIEEPFMTTENDYVSKINLALSHVNFPRQPVREIMGSWSKLNENLNSSDDFGKVLTGSFFLKKIVDEVTAGLITQEEKLHALHQYVVNNFEWNGIKDKYPEEIKKVVDAKKGTAADLNFILGSMLHKAGIPVDMVLLSTRDHGFIRKPYPMTKQFNYVIVSARIDDKTILIDATDKYLPLGVLPERCLNGEGLIISKTNHGWVNLEPKSRSRSVVNSDLILDESGALKGKMVLSYDGYNASKVRRGFFSKGNDAYLKDFLGNKSWELNNVEFTDLKDVSKGVKQSQEILISDHSTLGNDVIYINPFIMERMHENVFKQEKREYPINYGYPFDNTYMLTLTIPEGYEIDEIPLPKIISLPNGAGKYTYNITKQGEKLSLVSIMQVNKPMFVQTEYDYLKEFYNQIVAKQSEQIVLKKSK